MLVFAVETSCDETSICLINKDKEVLSHIIYSQKEHQDYGGVIPELASRSHLQILQEISRHALKKAKIKIEDIDLFSATVGPGLIGGLLVGSNFAKGLVIGSNKPFVPINHLEGHLLSPTFNNKVIYPYIGFLLTGGHTQIYLIKNINKYELLGETLDDAVGEAFDKVGKLLKMSYPGGPKIEESAKKGDKNFYNLPHPLIKEKNLNFSFSGIKTAVNLIVKKNNLKSEKVKSDIAASFQKTVAEIFVRKFYLVLKYLKKNNIKIHHLALVGGVAANKYIFNEMDKVAKQESCKIIIPTKDMLSDNAAMIGWACIQKYSINSFADINFRANPRLSIKETIQ